MALQAKQIFMDAVELPPADRSAFIQRACAEDPKLETRVAALLKAHDHASAALGEVPATIPDITDELEPGSAIHAYRLVEEVGSGGFGNVWLAEQQRPFKRLVAIKVLKAGMDSREVLARFEAEKQALALMDHSSIAKVFDAGTTPKGRPFFAMELVDGLPITDYCREHRLGTHARVRLAIQICEGLKHAHQKGVIHRDIKPTNVLVVDGDRQPQPKIIDFGIAKAIGGRLSQATIHTRIDQMIGTPGYMSPEQIGDKQDVDTRSDVYSVGALLYELLTEEQPLDLSDSNLASLQEKISKEEPIRPSTRLSTKSAATDGIARLPQREVRGDLDWIVMCCLEKDRDRRYDSVGLLASDLQRFLDGEVVSAGPPTLSYRSSKFLRRHWRSLMVTAAMIAVLITGTIVSIFQAQRADLARIDAETAESESKLELVRASAVADFLQNLLMGIDPATARGRDTAIVRDILQRSADNVAEASEGLPSVESELRTIIGGAYYAIGDFAESRFQLERALELRQAIGGKNDLKALSLALTLGPALGEDGNFEEAKTVLLWGYEGLREQLGPDHPDTRLALNNLAAILTDRGSPTELEPVLRDLERAATLDLGPDHEDSLRVRNNLAVLLSKLGKYEEAKSMQEEIYASQRRLLGDDHPRTMATMNNLAALYEHLGDLESAEAMLRELLERKLRLLPEGHPSLIIGQNNLAKFLDSNDKEAEAAELRAVAIESSLKHHGLANRFTLTLLIGEGLARLASEEWEPSERAFRQVIDNAEQVFGEDSAIELTAASNLAEVLVSTGRAQEACELMESRIDKLGPAFPESSEVHLVYPARYGLMLHAAGREAEALPYLKRGLEALAENDKHKKWHGKVSAALEHKTSAQTSAGTDP